jgi:hypothetical protein
MNPNKKMNSSPPKNVFVSSG